MKRTTTIEVPQNVLDKMNEILDREIGLEDTKDGNTIQTFYANFDNGFQADIKVCNGSHDSAPWVDCVLFDPTGGEITCCIGEAGALDGEYFLWDGEDEYQVLVEGVPRATTEIGITP